MKARIACLNYADYLDVTLPAWRQILGPDADLAVVTHPEDSNTARICARHGVPIIATDVWFANGADLNLAAAFDHAFAGTLTGQVCLHLGADNFPVGSLPPESEIQPRTIYGCRRYALSPDGGRGQVEPPANLPHIQEHGRGDSPEACAGYFQMFRFMEERPFGNSRDCSGYDYRFAFRWERGVTLDCIEVIHLGDRRKNWKGRVSERFDPVRLRAGVLA